MNDLISIIVPIYNVEKYIEKCIKSILNQTYKKIEIILVDDGSLDKCGSICDEYEKKDERIKVIHKKNGGLSDARNAGINICKGSYITFVDSDDYVTPDYIETLYKGIKKNNTKISIGDFLIKYDTGKEYNNSTGEIKVYSEKEILEKMLWGERDLDNSGCNKLYSRELFENLRYPVGRLYEDTATTYKVFSQCEKITVCEKPIYIYMKRKNSITQCEFNEKKLQLISAVEELTKYTREKYPDLALACQRKMIWSYMSTLSQLAASTTRNKKLEKELRTYVMNNKNDVLRSKKTPKRDKIGIICLTFGFSFYKIVWNIYLKINGKY